MNVKEAVYIRRAIRDDTADPIGEEAIRAVIDAAIQAPNSRSPSRIPNSPRPTSTSSATPRP